MKIVLHEDGLFINEKPIVFPIPITQFEQNFGALRSAHKKVNHIFTNDEHGFLLYSKDGKNAEVLDLVFSHETFDFSPQHLFSGTCAVNGKDVNDYCRDIDQSFGKKNVEVEDKITTIGDVSIYYDREGDVLRLVEFSQVKEAETHETVNPYILTTIDEPIIPFTDFNFKLVVINQLMYERDLLEPKFKLLAFIKHFKTRKIDYEEEGYDIIPEVKNYFEALPIPLSLATEIEELVTDWGGEIFHHLYPFWDGEDDIFKIQSFDDVKHFPNLKKIKMEYSEARKNMECLFDKNGIAIAYL